MDHIAKGNYPASVLNWRKNRWPLMSKLGIYIIEDEPLYANKLMMLVDELGYELAGHTNNSDTAFVEVNEKNPDLLLVDIQITGTMDGIGLVDKLSRQRHFPTIFITSFTDRETFDRAKSTKPYAFITKPFESETLQRTIELALNTIDHANSLDENDAWTGDLILNDAIFIKNRHRLEKVKIDDILYLEVEDRYSTIFTEDKKKYVLRMSMGNVQEKLPANQFIRTHRKYSVNISKITSIDTQDNLIFIGEMSIPISRSHKEGLLEKLDWMQ